MIVFLVLAGATGGASAAHAQTLPPSCTGFTDDPLQAGVTVKAQHLTELRACVDALRVQAGLAAVTWTDLALQAGATWIRAVHITELRTALGAVYTAHGETGPAYTDPALTAQATLVRAAHVTEIRTAILVVAGVCEPEACSNDGPIDQAIEYYHLDALGSVRAVTDEVGDVVRRHDYFPFGEGVSAIDGYVQRYAEQEGDPESGLSYVGARYYRAWTGRFTTVDPGHVGGDLFNPQSWNGYAYAHNNPVTFSDPTGLAAEQRQPDFRVLVVGNLPGSGSASKLPSTRSGNEDTSWSSFSWWAFSHLFDSWTMGDHSTGGGRGGRGGRREPPPPTDGGSGGEDGGPGPGGEPSTSPTGPDKPKTRARQQSSGGQNDTASPDYVYEMFGVYFTSAWWNDPRPACASWAAYDFFMTFSPVSPGWGTVAGAGAEAWQQQQYNKALTHAATRGLTYPLKSSVFRRYMTRALGPASFVTMGVVGMGEAIYKESQYAGSGLCK